MNQADGFLLISNPYLCPCAVLAHGHSNQACWNGSTRGTASSTRASTCPAQTQHACQHKNFTLYKSTITIRKINMQHRIKLYSESPREFIAKYYQFPFIPREGEIITIGTSHYIVSQIRYVFLSDNQLDIIIQANEHIYQGNQQCSPTDN